MNTVRIRWWMWIVAGVLLVVGAAWVLRIHGRGVFRQTQADIAAAGLVTDLTTLVAALPQVDTDRQRRLAALCQGLGTWADQHGRLPFSFDKPPATSREQKQHATFLLDGQSRMAEIEALLDEGPVLVGWAGEVNRDPSWLAKATQVEIWQFCYTHSLLAHRAFVNWWGSQASVASDPGPFLSRLRQWSDANQHPCTVIDAMIAIATCAIHAQVRLHLACQGRWPAEDRAAWLTETWNGQLYLADAFAGERCMNRAAVDADLFAYTEIIHSWTGGGSPTTLDHLQSLPSWILVGHETAVFNCAMARAEAAWRGLPQPQLRQMPFGLPHPYVDISLPNLLESHITAVEAEYGTRLSRVAACIAQAFHDGSPLPADDADLANRLPPSLLAAISPDQPAITYERLAESRFRVGLAAGVRPPAIPASRWSTQSAIGMPASQLPSDLRRWSIELDPAAVKHP